MKTITLDEAYHILEDCSAIIIDDADLPLYPHLAPLEDSDENEFLYLGWQNDDGLAYDVKFAEGENKEVKVSGSSMFIIDTEGDEVQFTILHPMNLE
jgi:hypothetical protein